MNSDLPPCISMEDLFRSLVKAVGREDIHIRGEPVIQRATTNAADGFNSIVLRVHLSYGFTKDDSTTNTKIFIVKCIPEVEVQVHFARTCNLFVREGRYFEEVLPIMKKVSEGKVEIPLPNCYHAVYEGDNEAFYMEDLGESGYQNSDKIFRSDGLDVEHCLVSMVTLGRLHALAIAAEKSIPPEKGNWLSMIPPFAKDALFFETSPGDPPAPLVGMIEHGIQTIIDLAKLIEGLPKEAEASGKLDVVCKGIWKTFMRLVKPDPEGRNLLNHGDFWMNNVMFRYKEDSTGHKIPVEAKFIDLQAVRYCNPSLDLLNFMYMGTTKCFRDIHLDRMIVEYYKSFERTLNIMNIKPPPFTLNELKSDFHGEYKPFGVIVGVVFTPILWLGEDIIPSTDEEMTAEELKEFFETGKAKMIRKRFAEDPQYRSKVEDAVKEFVEMAFPEGLENLERSPMLK